MKKNGWPTTGIGGGAGNPAVAAAAEELGYDSVWISEVNGGDAVTNICRIASSTTKMTIGTGIMCLYLRDPLLMAMTVNSLLDFAGHRITLGLGTSTQVIVERWHGLKWDHPIGRTRSYVDLVRRLLAGERVKEDGLYKLAGAQMAAASNGEVPIYLGALNPKMLRLAGSIADGVILNFPTLQYARRAIAIIEEGIAESGRKRSDVNISAFLRTTVTDDPASAVQSYRGELLTYVLAPVYRRVFTEDGYGSICDTINDMWTSGDRAGAAAALPDEMVHDHSIIGSATECRRRFQEFRDVGVDNAVVFAMAGGQENAADSVMHTVKTLAGA